MHEIICLSHLKIFVMLELCQTFSNSSRKECGLEHITQDTQVSLSQTWRTKATYLKQGVCMYCMAQLTYRAV